MTTFSELSLPENILKAVTELGFTEPTEIQEQAIPHLLQGQDVIGVAQTGTGKTAAFGLPLLTHVDPEKDEVQALVLAPTRELAMQGAEAISTFAAQIGGLEVVSVYGGSPYGPQLRALERGAQVVVGTPGRIMDLIDRGALKLEHVSYFVLDEADEMLRMGFAEDVDTIATNLPAERITALFSATMPNSIRKVAESHMSEPVEVTVTRPASTTETIHQTYAVVPSRHKTGALARVLATTDADAALVFVRTRATAEDLTIELSTRGVQAAALSGDVAQKDREKLVNRLREGTIDVLVATDVAARGLDVERIGLVVNYDVPKEIDTYVHRIGRTGRAGREGTSLTFVTPKEKFRLRRIEKTTGAQMEEVELPTPAEVSALRASRLVDSAIERVGVGRLSVYEKAVENFLAAQAEADEPMSLEQLAYGLLALGVRDPGPRADDEPEHLSIRGGREDRHERSERGGRGREKSGRKTFDHAGTMYRVEVGKKDGVAPGAIVGALTNEGGLTGSQLGKIDIYPTFSIVEIEHELDERTLSKLSRAQVSGRELGIRKDRGPAKSGHKPFKRDGGFGKRESGFSKRRNRDGDRRPYFDDYDPRGAQSRRDRERSSHDSYEFRKARADRAFGEKKAREGRNGFRNAGFTKGGAKKGGFRKGR
ncbi:ATP-dependent RNA helicase DeaD [Arcanobacterium wilhelmae]|uniref:RNA helicase n=1 Tax=Arcanobacterium wilhelmae TaxID=1803177 RepID=A0ABT9N8L9_9ACTO|nr:DEAD/DEAH box helicase [Arcanobacterium wilhelmae]MDP9800051.1 ATP-dependent RNA helicase DeaD [Arcanobacterium wilhelmae]WFN89546.1 DEAD/DEAH box helicase [Arcanobacterium wilhelmae]